MLPVPSFYKSHLPRPPWIFLLDPITVFQVLHVVIQVLFLDARILASQSLSFLIKTSTPSQPTATTRNPAGS